MVKEDVERSSRVAELRSGETPEASSARSSPAPGAVVKKKTAAEEKYDKIQEERVSRVVRVGRGWII